LIQSMQEQALGDRLKSCDDAMHNLRVIHLFANPNPNPNPSHI